MVSNLATSRNEIATVSLKRDPILGQRRENRSKIRHKKKSLNIEQYGEIRGEIDEKNNAH